MDRNFPGTSKKRVFETDFDGCNVDYLEIDEIQLESNEELISMYLHLGAKKLDYDNIRDMYLLKLNKRAEKRREK